MPEPILAPVAADVYSSVDQLDYDKQLHGWALMYFLQGIGLLIQDIYDLASDSDEGTGWSIILDPERTPTEGLAYVAMYVGVELDPQLPGESDYAYDRRMRDKIRQEGNFARGTPGAIIRAAQAHLIGSKRVVLNERDTSPYHYTVVTYTPETPDSSLVLKALQDAKPAGLQFSYIVSPGQTWNDVVASGKTWNAFNAAYSDWNHARDNLP